MTSDLAMRSGPRAFDAACVSRISRRWPASRTRWSHDSSTAIVDIDEILGTLDRKRRLAVRIAAERGWKARSVSVWLIVGDSRTNRRRVGAHRNLFLSSLPRDGRTLRPLFHNPAAGAESGICFWPDSTGAGIGQGFSVRQRVSRRRDGAGTANHAQRVDRNTMDGTRKWPPSPQIGPSSHPTQVGPDGRGQAGSLEPGPPGRRSSGDAAALA